MVIISYLVSNILTVFSIVAAVASTTGIIGSGTSATASDVASASDGSGSADICIAVDIAVDTDISLGYAHNTLLAHGHLDFNYHLKT